jgi:hypothetical protein
MRLISGQGFAIEMKPLMQSRQGRRALCGLGLGPQDPIQTRLNQFFEGGFPLCGSHLGSVKQIVGQINRGLHDGSKYGSKAISSNGHFLTQ